VVKFHTPVTSLPGNNPRTDRIDDCLDFRADMDVLERRKISFPAGF